jgi:hypothetical protein
MSTEAKVKTKITVADFEKRVESEAACLMYLERQKKDEAFKNAREYVAGKFEVKEKN